MVVRIDIRPIDSFDRRSFVLTLVLLGNPNKYVYINGIKNVISHAICYHAICSIMLYVIMLYAQSCYMLSSIMLQYLYIVLFGCCILVLNKKSMT